MMLTRTAAEWELLLNEAQVPASRVRTLEEAVADPQVTHRGTLASHSSGLKHRSPPSWPTRTAQRSSPPRRRWVPTPTTSSPQSASTPNNAPNSGPAGDLKTP